MVYSSEMNYTSLHGHIYSKYQIDNIINNPDYYHVEKCKIVDMMMKSSGIVSNVILKSKALPLLSHIVMPNKCNDNNFKNVQKAYKFLRDLHHELYTRDGLRNYLAYGEAVYYLQHKENKPSLIPLDKQYIKFEGLKNNEFIVSFNLDYFDDQVNIERSNYDNELEVVDILRNYPKEFAAAYHKYKNNMSIRNQWFLLDRNKTFAVKRGILDSEHGESLIMPVIKDILFSKEYIESLRDNIRDNSSQIWGLEQPESEKKGICSLNREQQKMQFDNFNNAINKQNMQSKNGYASFATSFVVAPGTKIHKMDFGNELLKNPMRKETNDQLSIGLGFGMGILGGESKDNFASQKLNIDLILSEIYEYLGLASKQIEKLIKTYYNFNDDNSVIFTYFNVSKMDKEKKFNDAKELYTMAGGSRVYLYAMGADDPQSYMKLLDMEKHLNLDEKYPPNQTSFTLSPKDNVSDDKGGRPTKDDDKLSVSGEKTRANGYNEQPKK